LQPLTQEARINPDIQDRLGQQLRAMYDQLRTEPVPERILDLLTRLNETRPEQKH
jgi:hypothetical protein